MGDREFGFDKEKFFFAQADGEPTSKARRGESGPSQEVAHYAKRENPLRRRYLPTHGQMAEFSQEDLSSYDDDVFWASQPSLGRQGDTP
eukprot:6085491-Amphidinium_carterae.1